jgi:hypothetical protein
MGGARDQRARLSPCAGRSDGVASLRDHDFSVSISHSSNDELGELVGAYNSLGNLLRRERLDLHQRELLLDTTPLALVLTNASASRSAVRSSKRMAGASASRTARVAALP